MFIVCVCVCVSFRPQCAQVICFALFSSCRTRREAETVTCRWKPKTIDSSTYSSKVRQRLPRKILEGNTAQLVSGETWFSFWLFTLLSLYFSSFARFFSDRVLPISCCCFIQFLRRNFLWGGFFFARLVSHSADCRGRRDVDGCAAVASYSTASSQRKFFSYRSPFSCLLGSRHRLCFASAEATVGDRADLLPLRYFSLVFRFFFVLFGVGGGGETWASKKDHLPRSK